MAGKSKVRPIDMDRRSPAGSELEPPKQASDYPKGSFGNASTSAPTWVDEPGGNVVVDTRGGGKVYLGNTKPGPREKKAPGANDPWMSTKDTGEHAERGKPETGEPASIERDVDHRNQPDPEPEKDEKDGASSPGNSSTQSSKKPEQKSDDPKSSDPQPARVTELRSSRGRKGSSGAGSAATDSGKDKK